MSKFVVRIVVIAAVLVGLVYGGILLWTKVINKPEDRLSEADLGAALVTGDSVVGEPDSGDVSGTWTATNDSTLGYRVKEVLGGVDTEGVGRTNDVDGEIVLEGTVLTAASFAVDVATITSDSSRRDGQFTGRIMDAATHPQATFTLTAPIDFGSVPAVGEQVIVEATGDLTLRGTTRSVTFPLTAEYSGTQIAVLGNIPIVFSDYGIPNPSNNFVKTGDDGLLEFVLVFSRVT